MPARMGQQHKETARKTRVLFLSVFLLMLTYVGADELSAEAVSSLPDACRSGVIEHCHFFLIPLASISIFPPGVIEHASFTGTCSAACMGHVQQFCNDQPEFQKKVEAACSAFQCWQAVGSSCGKASRKSGSMLNMTAACTAQCASTLNSDVCRGTERVFPEYTSYKASVGPLGTECVAWDCVKEVEQNCDDYDEPTRTLPSTSLCKGSCYLSLRRDSCMASSIKVVDVLGGLLGTWADLSQGDSYGPLSPQCGQLFGDIASSNLPSDEPYCAPRGSCNGTLAGAAWCGESEANCRQCQLNWCKATPPPPTGPPNSASPDGSNRLINSTSMLPPGSNEPPAESPGRSSGSPVGPTPSQPSSSPTDPSPAVAVTVASAQPPGQEFPTPGGMDQHTKSLIIGLVVGLGGAALIAVAAIAIARSRREDKDEDEEEPPASGEAAGAAAAGGGMEAPPGPEEPALPTRLATSIGAEGGSVTAIV